MPIKGKHWPFIITKILTDRKAKRIEIMLRVDDMPPDKFDELLQWLKNQSGHRLPIFILHEFKEK